MMMTWYGNVFRIAGHLWEETIADNGPVMRSFGVLFCFCMNKLMLLNNQSSYRLLDQFCHPDEHHGWHMMLCRLHPDVLGEAFMLFSETHRRIFAYFISTGTLDGTTRPIKTCLSYIVEAIYFGCWCSGGTEIRGFGLLSLHYSGFNTERVIKYYLW